MYQKNEIEKGLRLFGDILKLKGYKDIRFLICGGTALILSNILDRPTKDIDILGLGYLDSEYEVQFQDPNPLSPEIQEAIKQVSDILGWDNNWLNTGPYDLLKFGLPHGFKDRLIIQKFGSILTIYILGRFDLIHLKLYAAVDQGPGRHLEDLFKLKPIYEDIEFSVKWCLTHDSSEGFKLTLKEMLKSIGYESIAKKV